MRKLVEDVPNYTIEIIDPCDVCGKKRSLTRVRINGKYKLACTPCRKTLREISPERHTTADIDAPDAADTKAHNDGDPTMATPKKTTTKKTAAKKAPAKKTAAKKTTPAKKAAPSKVAKRTIAPPQKSATAKKATTAKTSAPAKTAAKKTAAPKKEKAPKVARLRQNGFTRPNGGKTGRVWDVADQISAKEKRPAERAEVLAIVVDKEKGNKAMAATQYSRWRAYNGLKRDTTRAAKPAVAKEAAAPAKKAAAKKTTAKKGATKTTDAIPAPAETSAPATNAAQIVDEDEDEE